MRGSFEAKEIHTFVDLGNEQAITETQACKADSNSTTNQANISVRRKRFTPTIPSERRPKQRGESKGCEPKPSARVDQLMKDARMDTAPRREQGVQNNATHHAHRESLYPSICSASPQRNDSDEMIGHAATMLDHGIDSGRHIESQLPKEIDSFSFAGQQIDLHSMTYQAHQHQRHTLETRINGHNVSELNLSTPLSSSLHFGGHSNTKCVGEILACATNGHYAIIQIPGKLPMAHGAVSTFPCTDQTSCMSGVEPSLGEAKASSKPNMLRLSDLPEGTIGELLFYEDGSVKMKVGEGAFDVVQGTSSLHSEHIACIDTLRRDCSFLGQIPGRLVCTPDLSLMLKQDPID